MLNLFSFRVLADLSWLPNESVTDLRCRPEVMLARLEGRLNPGSGESIHQVENLIFWPFSVFFGGKKQLKTNKNHQQPLKNDQKPPKTNKDGCCWCTNSNSPRSTALGPGAWAGRWGEEQRDLAVEGLFFFFWGGELFFFLFLGEALVVFFWGLFLFFDVFWHF